MKRVTSDILSLQSFVPRRTNTCFEVAKGSLAGIEKVTDHFGSSALSWVREAGIRILIGPLSFEPHGSGENLPLHPRRRMSYPFPQPKSTVNHVDTELVILVDEQNQVLGTMPKAEVHGATTPLHRAFSSFVFRSSDRRLLLQQRSAKKVAWPLIWSNSCCGHPGPGESNVDAARRRLKFELGLVPMLLEEVAPYRYCFCKDGMMENEICPILAGLVDQEPVINPDEVQRVRWMAWEEFLAAIEKNPKEYSDWCVDQAQILERTPRLKELLIRSV